MRGVQVEFLVRIREVDHVVPRSRGGSDHPENLQLLCPNCNRIKGDRDMAYWWRGWGRGRGGGNQTRARHIIAVTSTLKYKLRPRWAKVHSVKGLP